MSRFCLQLFLLSLLGWVGGLSLAHAYVGPGTGLSAIGAFLALLVGVVVAIFGFLWYPLKRLLGRKSREPEQTETPPMEPAARQGHEQQR